MTEDEQAIRELVHAWTIANKVGDVATMLSLVTDDVVFLVPGCDPLGRELLEAAPPTSSVRVEGVNDIVELQVLGVGLSRAIKSTRPSLQLAAKLFISAGAFWRSFDKKRTVAGGWPATRTC